MKSNLIVHLLETPPIVNGINGDLGFMRVSVLGRVINGPKKSQDRQTTTIMTIHEAAKHAVDILSHVPLSAFEGGELDPQVARLRKLLTIINRAKEPAAPTTSSA